MKKYTILLFTFILFCCKTEKKTDIIVPFKKEKFDFNKARADSNSIKKEEFSDSIKQKVIFNSSYLKSKTIKLSDQISVAFNPSINNNNPIPKKFLSKFISTHKIDIGFPEYLSDDYPNSYTFKEYKEYAEFELYTFTYNDESCCTILYAVTAKKGTLEVISISVIGYTGGDGGWNGEKYGVWKSDYLISNIEPSDYEEIAPEEPVEIEIDTIWSEIRILKNGKMNYSEIKSVKYLGSKKVESKEINQ